MRERGTGLFFLTYMLLLAAAVLLLIDRAMGEPFEIYPDSGIMSQFDSHLQAEQHYFHCSLFGFQTWNALGMCLEQIREHEPDCVGIQRNELYKPRSESHGTPALLLAGSLHGESLSIEDAAGNRVGSVLRTSCCNNGGRAHWFFRERCEDLPSPTILKVGGLCRTIPDPCRRYE